MRKLSSLLIHTFFNHFSIIPDVVCMNFLGTMDGRWRMYACFWHMSVLSDSSLRNWSHEFCIVNEFRGTCLELGCNTASTTADLTSMCWPKMEIMTTTNWSMIDEWSLALTLALQQMLTEVFTAQRCSLCLVACSLHDFLCQAWVDSPVFTAPTGRRHMNLAHDSGRCQRANLERKVSSLESLQERAKLYVMGTKKEDRYLCGTRALAQMDPETQLCKVIHVPISQERVVGAHPNVSALRTALEAKPIQEAARLFRHLMVLKGLPPRNGRQHAKVDPSFCQSSKSSSSLSRCEHRRRHLFSSSDSWDHITGVQTVEPTETAAVLAASGSTTCEGSTIGNSCILRDAVGNCNAQWDDDTFQSRNSPRRRAGHLSATASSLRHQLVSPTFFEEREQCNVLMGR